MMKVLVTGASGFIGSHLCEALLKKGFKVKAFVKYKSVKKKGWLKNILSKNLQIVYGNIADYKDVLKAVKGCDYVFNLAASISVPYSYKKPQIFIDTNILGALNILRASNLCKSKIKKVVQISSSEVYGNKLLKDKKILKEDAITVSESPYAETKIASENLVMSIYKTTGMPIVIARPFNTFGPKQSLRAVIPTIITQFISLNKKNNSINIGNLQARRDFIYVIDTVNGLISLLKKSCKPGQVYNICTGKTFSVKNIINNLNLITKKKPKILISKKRLRTTDLKELKGSNKKLFKSNNWSPKYKNKDGFKKALSETYEWFSDKKNLKNYSDIKKYYI
tara:strand:- start:5656 stop:6666 length:1011 start_codon:yes stop_codon:yes gene_type:complete